MKVTVCFGNVRVVVPCKDGDIFVQDLIDKAIVRYKKATGKPSGSWVTVHNLKSLSDGGILDRDDKLNDVADDREQIIAIYEEQNAPYMVHNGGDGTSTSSVGTESPDIFQMETEVKSVAALPCHTDVESLGDCVPSGISTLQVRRGSEPALNRLSPTPNSFLDPMKRWSTAVVLDDKNQNCSTSLLKDNREDPIDGEVLSERGDGSGEEKSSAFMRFARDSGRLSVLGSNGASNRWLDAADRQALKLLGGGRRDPVGGPSVQSRDSSKERDLYDRSQLVVLRNDGGPLGIHVIPEYDETGRAQDIFKEALQCPEIMMRLIKDTSEGNSRPPPPVFPRPGLFINGCDTETDNQSLDNRNAANSWITSVNNTNKGPTPTLTRNANAMLTSNTRRIGKKYPIPLTKGPNGLGFSITTRDNLAGGNCPIYIKNILPKGAAVEDGRLKPGDRLLEVNGIEMTGKSQDEAAALLRNAPTGSVVNLIVSRQEAESPNLPRQLMGSDFYSSGGEPPHPPVMPSALAVNGPPPEKMTDDGMIFPWKHRELLKLEIPLNDTGSAGLGVSVKGKTSTGPNGTVDLGIFVKSVIHGGAASKDGRLCENDQLVSVNGVSLLGRANSYAMETLRRVMHQEGPNPGAITLTIARRVSPSGSGDRSLVGSQTQSRPSPSSSSSAPTRTNLESSSVATTNGVAGGQRVQTPTSDVTSVASGSTSTTTDSERTTVFRPFGRSSGHSSASGHPSYQSVQADAQEQQRQQRHFVNSAGYGHIEDKDLGTDCYPSPLRNPIVDRITGQKGGGGQQPRNDSYYQACHDSWTGTPQGGGSKQYLAEHRVPLSPPQTQQQRLQLQQQRHLMAGMTSPTISVSHDDSVMIEDEYGAPAHQAPRNSEPVVPLSAVPPGLAVANDQNPAYVSQASLEEDPANFDRDGFGRQSMSEKRNAQLDARNTDTWQRNKKAREQKDKKKGGSGEISSAVDGTRLPEVGSTNLVRSNSADSLMSVSRGQKIANGGGIIKKSNSLESLRNDSEGVYGRQSSGNAPGRNRVCNESFRAAVDRSIDPPPLEPGETMDTVDEESESGSSSNVGRGSLRQGNASFSVNPVPGGELLGENGVLYGSKKDKKKGFIKSLFRIGKNKKEPNNKSRQSAILGIESNEHYMKIDPDAIYSQKVSDEEQERLQLEQQKRLAAPPAEWKQKAGEVVLQLQDQFHSQHPSSTTTTTSSSNGSGSANHHHHQMFLGKTMSSTGSGHHLAPSSRLAAYQNGTGAVRPPPPPVPAHASEMSVGAPPNQSSEAAPSSRTEKISQLRAQHQKKHVERQGHYPLDDREEKLQKHTQEQVDRKNENPSVLKKFWPGEGLVTLEGNRRSCRGFYHEYQRYETEAVHSRSHSYDLYQERPRAPPTTDATKTHNKYSHYMNYEEIQQHILRQQRPRPSAPVPGHRKERPVSNYYEYESIQPTYSLGGNVATAVVVSVTGDGGSGSTTGSSSSRHQHQHQHQHHHHHHQQQQQQQQQQPQQQYQHHHHNHTHNKVTPTNNYPVPAQAFAGSNHSSLRSGHSRPTFTHQQGDGAGQRGNPPPVNGSSSNNNHHQQLQQRTVFKTGNGKAAAPGRPAGTSSATVASQSRPSYHVTSVTSTSANKYLQQQHVVRTSATSARGGGTRDPSLAGSKV